MSSLVSWLTLIFVAFFTPDFVYGMHSAIYFISCLICAFGAIFCYKFVKETDGLSDKQKKLLYEVPDDKPKSRLQSLIIQKQ